MSIAVAVRAPADPAPVWSRTVLHLGDLHHGTANATTRSDIARTALLTLPVPAALVQVGDLVEPDSAGNDTTAKNYINSLQGTVKRVIIGNHDCDTGRTAAAAATSFGYNARNWSHDLAWARLIGVSPASFPANGAADEGTCLLDATALSFLDSALAGTSLPCLVFSHAPLENTVIAEITGVNAGYSSDEATFSVDPDAEVRAVLAAHSNAKAFISGHTHSFLSATGFVKLENLGARSIVCVNSSAIRGQRRPAVISDPIVAVFTTLTTTHVEVRAFDCNAKRWAIWPATGTTLQRLPIPA